MEVEIHIKWLKEFLAKIDKKWEVQEALNIWIKKIFFFLEWEAKVKTPVDTWVLRNSYRQEFKSLFWRLFNIREYGAFVHEGTRFIKSNPFLTETARESAREVNLIMNEELIANLKILR